MDTSEVTERKGLNISSPRGYFAVDGVRDNYPALFWLLGTLGLEKYVHNIDSIEKVEVRFTDSPFYTEALLTFLPSESRWVLLDLELTDGIESATSYLMSLKYPDTRVSLFTIINRALLITGTGSQTIHSNIAKLAEEVGELSEIGFHDHTSHDPAHVASEVADVVAVALSHLAFYPEARDYFVQQLDQKLAKGEIQYGIGGKTSFRSLPEEEQKHRIDKVRCTDGFFPNNFNIDNTSGRY